MRWGNNDLQYGIEKHNSSHLFTFFKCQNPSAVNAFAPKRAFDLLAKKKKKHDKQ